MSSASSSGEIAFDRAHRVDQGADDRGVEHRAAGGHLADGPGELVALGDPVLQQVGVPGRALGQERDGVVGVVVLREDDDAGAGVALADLLAAVDALVLEVRRHADVGDDHLRGGRVGARDQPVVVLGDANDLQVGLALEHRPHALADDDAVVGEEHRDRGTSPHWRPLSQVARATTRRVAVRRGGCQPHHSRAVVRWPLWAGWRTVDQWMRCACAQGGCSATTSWRRSPSRSSPGWSVVSRSAPWTSARRSAGALARFLDAADLPTLSVTFCPPDVVDPTVEDLQEKCFPYDAVDELAQLRSLPTVRQAVRVAGRAAIMAGPAEASDDPVFVTMMRDPGLESVGGRPVVLAGRLADDDADDEAVINEQFRDVYGVDVGDRVQLQFLTAADLGSAGAEQRGSSADRRRSRSSGSSEPRTTSTRA